MADAVAQKSTSLAEVLSPLSLSFTHFLSPSLDSLPGRNLFCGSDVRMPYMISLCRWFKIVITQKYSLVGSYD
ncbi:hypothetical protein KSP40_PGU014646 [Platanthera guangdongensis]|uniref:Uncharacterized protein n=1 Tax=Platanthera guangdongensis TaxID=2320717 RepID=A0ABR2N343_9ASPA